MTWVDKDVRVLSRKHISRELRVFLIFICGKTLTFLLLVLVQIELLLSAPENLGGGEPLSFDWKRSSCNDDYDDDYDYPAMMIMTMCVTPLYPLHNPISVIWVTRQVGLQLEVGAWRLPGLQVSI